MAPKDRTRLGIISPDWPASNRETALLLLVAVVAATITWVSRDDRLPLVADRDFYELELSAPVVDIHEALTLFDEGNHLFIDTRPDPAQQKDTIPGAFLIRASSFGDDLYELADTVYPEDPVILFGGGDLSGTSHVADLLLTRGFEDILILRGSVAAWREQGGEISSPTPPPSSDLGETP